MDFYDLSFKDLFVVLNIHAFVWTFMSYVQQGNAETCGYNTKSSGSLKLEAGVRWLDLQFLRI